MAKRVILLILCVAMLLSFTGCGKKNPHDARMQTARELVLQAWAKVYRDLPTETDGTVQIQSARLIILQDCDDKHSKYLENVAYIAEFTVFTDYYGTAPYYVNAGMLDCVVFYKDGSAEVTRLNLLKSIQSSTFAFPTAHIREVIDFGSTYNITTKVPYAP